MADKESPGVEGQRVTNDISTDRIASREAVTISRAQWYYNRVTYTPRRCRYDPDKKFQFSMGLNLLFGFASTFTVANLYYNHPILNKLAADFHVTDEQSSFVPTLSQAGYAGGLLLLCPLGDLVCRRAFVLWLVWFTATTWSFSLSISRREADEKARLGLCLTNNFAVFCALSFITCFTTVTPQLMLPLVGDLAPPNRRALAISIVTSGLILGMLIARLLSGIVANYIGWRYIYWIAFGLQYLILILLWLFMPDYPSTNPDVSIWRKYPVLLIDVGRMLFRHPILVQACLIGFFTASTFTSFWTTLTFLLAGAPYHYDSVKIGLFALIGIGSISWGPIFARVFMEKHQPLLSVMIGGTIALVGIIVGTYTGHLSSAGPAIQALMIDVGLQTSQIGNRTAIYRVEPKGRNRVNTAYMVSVFCGQLMGTAAGNHLYAHGGWISSGSASVGFAGAALLICFSRGPNEPGWIGWRGGWRMEKTDPASTQATVVDEENSANGNNVPQAFAVGDEGGKLPPNAKENEGAKQPSSLRNSELGQTLADASVARKSDEMDIEQGKEKEI